MAAPKAAPAKAPLLTVGMLVHLVSGGRTLQNYEVLDMDENYVKLRANAQIAPQTDVILVPHGKIEMLGLPGER
jgi:hypothetical protein